MMGQVRPLGLILQSSDDDACLATMIVPSIDWAASDDIALAEPVWAAILSRN